MIDILMDGTIYALAGNILLWCYIIKRRREMRDE
jgi:hypothetical protein